MTFLHQLILGFSSAVVLVWLKHHFFVLTDDWLSISLPFLVCSLGISLVFVLFYGIQKKHPSFTLPTFRPFFLPLAIFYFGLLIFNTQAFLRGIILSNGPLVPLSSFLSVNLSYGSKLGSVFLLFFFLTLAFFSAGNFFLKLAAQVPDERASTAYGTILRLIVGIFSWSAFLLMLGMVGALHQLPISIAFLLLLLSERIPIRQLLRLGIESKQFGNEQKPSQILLTLLGLFLIAFTLTQSLRPEPTGYDDMTQYMNRASLMANEERLIAGGNPYPFELISAGIRIAAHDDTMLFAMSFGTYSLLFGAFILFAFGQSLGESRLTGLLSSVIYLALPMSAALTIREVKPDPLLVALAIFVFWALYKSLHEKKIRSWYAAVFVFCFALTVKLTGLFLLAPIAIVAILLFFSKEFSSNRLKIITLSFAIALLALSFWLIYGFSTRPLSLPVTPQEILSSDTATNPVSQLSVELSTYARDNACISTGSSEDFARFDSGRGPIEKWIAFPWDLTLNLEAKAFATEITCLFLALLPLFLIVRRKSQESVTWTDRPVLILSIFSFSYFALWLFFGSGVAWYALPGFALLGVLIALLAKRVEDAPLLKVFFWIVLSMGLLGGTLIQMKLTSERAQVLYASGQLSPEQFLGQAIPSFSPAIDILNLFPDSRVLITSSQLWYGITNNHERAVMDSYLDMFNCLYRERDDALTLERLDHFGIRYILYARGYTAELDSQGRPTFDAKIKALTDFLGKNLQVVWGSPHYLIFEVP